jgi:hypothetical protein
MEYHCLGYFAYFTCPVSQVHFTKVWSPHCNLAILASWLYLFPNSTFQNYKVQIAQLSSLCCHVCIPKLPLHIAIRPFDYFAELPKSTSPCGLHEWASSSLNFKNISGLSMVCWLDLFFSDHPILQDGLCLASPSTVARDIYMPQPILWLE